MYSLILYARRFVYPIVLYSFTPLISLSPQKSPYALRTIINNYVYIQQQYSNSVRTKKHESLLYANQLYAFLSVYAQPSTQHR